MSQLHHHLIMNSVSIFIQGGACELVCVSAALHEVMFHESLEGAWLDKVDRCYAWLRRTLITYEEECQSIFPAEWGIPERVTIQFCNTTRSVSVYEREREREREIACVRGRVCVYLC